MKTAFEQLIWLDDVDEDTIVQLDVGFGTAFACVWLAIKHRINIDDRCKERTLRRDWLVVAYADDIVGQKCGPC